MLSCQPHPHTTYQWLFADAQKLYMGNPTQLCGFLGSYKPCFTYVYDMGWFAQDQSGIRKESNGHTSLFYIMAFLHVVVCSDYARKQFPFLTKMLPISLSFQITVIKFLMLCVSFILLLLMFFQKANKQNCTLPINIKLTLQAVHCNSHIKYVCMHIGMYLITYLYY